MGYDERSDGSSSGDAQDCFQRSMSAKMGAPPTMPKHIPFPEHATTSEWLSELIMCAFTMGAAIVQFINIYRTNWWLPQFHARHMVNIELIDPYLRYLILILNTRRFLYCLLLAKWRSTKRRLLRLGIKYGFGGFVQLALGYCAFRLYQQHTYMLLFYLSYPVVVYLIIFGFQLEPFLRSRFEVPGVYINDMPVHSCTTNAGQIRAEIETLRHDFNKRFKQLIFTCMLNAYLVLIPCLLALSIQYNVMRAAQHCIIVCLGAFSLSAVFLYPAKYSDTLHRATLHLGSWQRMDRDPQAAPSQLIVAANAQTWSKCTVYGHATVVKHNGALYRSHGLVTVATPGNASHLRFYKLFHNPTVIYSTLATLQAAVLLVEIASLSAAIEWHFVLSVSFVAFTSMIAFFKLVRDYLITKHLYKAETQPFTIKSSTAI